MVVFDLDNTLRDVRSPGIASYIPKYKAKAVEWTKWSEKANELATANDKVVELLELSERDDVHIVTSALDPVAWIDKNINLHCTIHHRDINDNRTELELKKEFIDKHAGEIAEWYDDNEEVLEYVDRNTLAKCYLVINGEAKEYRYKYPDMLHPECVGVKHDQDKPQMSLLPTSAILEMSKVITFGAKKYSPDNWKSVEKHRYVDALLRHCFAYMQEQNDEESGLHHLAHAMSCAAFIIEKDLG